MTEFLTLLEDYLQRAELKLSAPQKGQLAQHWQLVQETNAKFNLTAITSDEETVNKHYLDCLLALPLITHYFPAASPRTLDIGSGAGFPGLVLAIALPEAHVTLLESTQKKAAFLEEASHTLALAKVSVLPLRAEQVGRLPEHRANYDLITARAVAPLAVLVEYALPLLRQGGYLLAYKGPNAAEELAAAERALRLLNGQVAACQLTQLPTGERRTLVLVQKTGETSQKYPRRDGLPKKEPL